MTESEIIKFLLMLCIVILGLVVGLAAATAGTHVDVEIYTESPATPEICPCVKVYDPATNTVNAECHC